MSLEKKILSACLHSRTAFEKMEDHLEGRISLPISDIVIDSCREYYARDGTAKAVDMDWLLEKLAILFDNPKKAGEYQDFVKELFAFQGSDDNITDLILAAKRKEIGHKLAAALANDADNVDELIQQFQDIGTQEELENEEEVLQNVSVAESISTVLNKASLIKLPTKALNEAVDGGALPGHHIVVVARPEAGKTATCISFVRAFAYQELPGIYFGNEDPIRQIILRSQCAFTGMTKDQIRDNPEEAQKRLDASGFHLVRFIQLNPGTPAEIDKYVKMYGAKWIVLDQLRNLFVRSDTRVNQLEAAGTSQRNLAIRRHLVAVSVTQAGDSAEGKLVCGMGDVDFSNTGIPATADLMVMIGVNQEYEANGLRMISLPKNKLSGSHVHFPLRINPQISRLEDI